MVAAPAELGIAATAQPAAMQMAIVSSRNRPNFTVILALSHGFRLPRE
jgi:hypothetical protein